MGSYWPKVMGQDKGCASRVPSIGLCPQKSTIPVLARGCASRVPSMGLCPLKNTLTKLLALLHKTIAILVQYPAKGHMFYYQNLL